MYQAWPLRNRCGTCPSCPQIQSFPSPPPPSSSAGKNKCQHARCRGVSHESVYLPLTNKSHTYACWRQHGGYVAAYASECQRVQAVQRALWTAQDGCVVYPPPKLGCLALEFEFVCELGSCCCGDLDLMCLLAVGGMPELKARFTQQRSTPLRSCCANYCHGKYVILQPCYANRPFVMLCKQPFEFGIHFLD